jgi:RNase P subunit RPR2
MKSNFIEKRRSDNLRKLICSGCAVVLVSPASEGRASHGNEQSTKKLTVFLCLCSGLHKASFDAGELLRCSAFNS